MTPVPFNRPWASGRETDLMQQVMASHAYAGGGRFTALCEHWLEDRIGCHKALLTPSCTAALEMTALLLGIGPGDEIIMPSYTFVSTANAFVLRGAVPVFVDVRPDTLNIDERLIESAITARTRAIVVVHYAGVPCDMTAIAEIASRNGLFLVEDAAHAVGATWNGKAVGSFGQLATLSFHQTKNMHCGEGGALLVNDPALLARAEIIREKGSNKADFMRGRIREYTWLDIGGSFLMSEISAAFLYAQMQAFDSILASRRAAWRRYLQGLSPLSADHLLTCPTTATELDHNAHIFAVQLPTPALRSALLQHLQTRDVQAASHYVPLHDSPAGRRFGRTHGPLPATVMAAAQSLRLPLWTQMPELALERVIDEVNSFFGRRKNHSG